MTRRQIGKARVSRENLYVLNKEVPKIHKAISLIA